jgi:hypothetical protein
MRKKLFLYLWLLTPVVLLAYHYGPGQSGLARDAASQLIATARACEAKEDWRGAMEAYGEALGKLPGTDTATRWSLRLAQSKARMRSGELPESITDFEGLLTDVEAGGGTPAQAEEVRANLGTAQYYAGWLMRLEGAKTEEWTVPVESARQQFRLLAEEKARWRSCRGEAIPGESRGHRPPGADGSLRAAGNAAAEVLPGLQKREPEVPLPMPEQVQEARREGAEGCSRRRLRRAAARRILNPQTLRRSWELSLFVS